MQGGGLVDLGEAFTPTSSNPGPFTCADGSTATFSPTDAISPGSGAGLAFADIGGVTFEFLNTDQTHHVENGNGIFVQIK